MLVDDMQGDQNQDVFEAREAENRTGMPDCGSRCLILSRPCFVRSRSSSAVCSAIARPRAALVAENALLRQEVIVLGRGRPHPRLKPRDRFTIAALTKFFPGATGRRDHRAPGNRDSLASVPLALGLATSLPAPRRAPTHRCGHPRPDPTHVEGESALG